MESRKGIIYAYRNKINGKMYIGKTCQNEELRKAQHKNSKKNDHFHNAIRFHGFDNFEYFVIKDNIETEEDLNKLEMFYIKQYETFTDKMKGYNSTAGGEGSVGHKPTKETRELMSKARTGLKRTEEQKRNMSIAQTGREVTEEHRKKISVAHTGRKRSPEHIKNAAEGAYKKIEQWSLDGNLVKVWNSIKEAGETLKIHRGSISGCANGYPKNKTAGKFIWRFYNPNSDLSSSIV
jgi:group I intron endonuclease